MKEITNSDVAVLNEGSIFLFRPNTEAGRNWINDNIADDAIWHNDSLVVEHRFVQDIIDGMIEDGLLIS